MSALPETKSYKFGDRAGRMFAECGSGDYRYSVGWITTPHGVVGMYREPGLITAVVVAGGREHRIWWRRDFTEARLITECKRFARAVHPPTDPADGAPLRVSPIGEGDA